MVVFVHLCKELKYFITILENCILDFLCVCVSSAIETEYFTLTFNYFTCGKNTDLRYLLLLYNSGINNLIQNTEV